MNPSAPSSPTSPTPQQLTTPPKPPPRRSPTPSTTPVSPSHSQTFSPSPPTLSYTPPRSNTPLISYTPPRSNTPLISYTPPQSDTPRSSSPFPTEPSDFEPPLLGQLSAIPTYLSPSGGSSKNSSRRWVGEARLVCWGVNEGNEIPSVKWMEKIIINQEMKFLQ